VGLEAEELVLEPLASGEAVLSQAERDLGAAVVDIGGGTTSLGIFTNGGLCHTAILPVGGNHITNDIAVGLRTPIAEAEKLKIGHGCATLAMVGDGESIEVARIGSPDITVRPRRALVEIIEPRLTEILGMVNAQIKRSGYASLIPAGVVVTGGSALLTGLADAASAQLELPARVGIPEVAGTMDLTVGSPIYATGVGLVMYAARQRSPGRLVRTMDGGGTVFGRLRRWFREFTQGA
jgi:cell division protein FtsA